MAHLFKKVNQQHVPPNDCVKQNTECKDKYIIKHIKAYWQLYILLLPAFVYTLVICYKPMYGILIAFKDYSPRRGIWGSEWVGFKHFERLFSSYWFPITLKNTLTISLLSLILTTPIPIMFALIINETKNVKYRKFVQTVSYAPHFISTVVLCGMIFLFLDVKSGFVSKIVEFVVGEPIVFMQDPHWFKWVYIISGVWQGMGWSSIIYFAALSGVDKALLEAAEIDGATRIQRIRYINLPTIMPTIAIMFILSCGNLISVGYEKAYLLQTAPNLSASEIISTYVYKVGLIDGDYEFSTAASLFNTVVNVTMLLIANKLSKKITDNEVSLF